MFLPASATVEVSLVIPLYIYAVLAVAYVIQIIGIKSTMYKAMYNSTRQLAAYHVNAVLIGETLMRSPDKKTALDLLRP